MSKYFSAFDLSSNSKRSHLIRLTPSTCGLLPRLITVTAFPLPMKYSAVNLLTKVVPPVIRIFIDIGTFPS